MRQHVKVLRIDLHLLPINTSTEPDLENVWECLIHDRYCYPFIYSNDCEQEFKEAIAEQKELEQSGHGVDLLASAFRQLPNLREVEISNRGRLPCGIAFYSACHPDRMVDREEDCGRIQLQHLVRAAAAAGDKFNLEKFIIWHQEYPIVALHQSMIELGPQDMIHAKRTFANVRIFTWHICMIFDDDADKDQATALNFLNSMSSLEELNLSRPANQRCYWAPEFMDAILKNGYWRNLDTIVIPGSDSDFDLDGFMSFATRHASTLRRLTFIDLRVSKSCLRTLSTRLREVIFSLEAFEASGYLKTTDGEGARAYRVSWNIGNGVWSTDGTLSDGQNKENWL